MLERKMFWYSLQAFSLAGWTFNAIGVIRPYNNKAIRRIWQMAMPLWALLHPAEIPFAYGWAGKGAGASLKRTVLKTMLYGFTWWVPLKRGVFEK